MFVFGEKAVSTPPGYPGGENLWAAVFRLIVEEKHGIFNSFQGSFGVAAERPILKCVMELELYWGAKKRHRDMAFSTI